MDPLKLSFLVGVVGADGAKALAKAVAHSEQLEGVIIPRALLSWLEVIGCGDFDGAIPGADNTRLQFYKSENQYTGYVSFGKDVYDFSGVDLFHVAGSVAVALGHDKEFEVPSPSPGLAKLGKSLDLLVKSRALRKMQSEALEKTSWNVKQRRRYQFEPGADKPKNYYTGRSDMKGKPDPLTAAQVSDRRKKYAESIGLKPKYGVSETDSTGGFPNAGQGNDLPYNDTFDIAHEVGHAVATPVADTLGRYQQWLSARGQKPTPFDGGHDDFEDRLVDYDEGLHHENVASAAEPHIDRRAGLDPHAFKSKYRDTMQSAYEDDESLYDPKSGTVPATTKMPTDGWDRGFGRNNATGGKNPIPGAHIREEAAANVKEFDEGRKFNHVGQPVQPTGPDAKINRRVKLPGMSTPRQKITLKAEPKASGSAQGITPRGPAAAPLAPKGPIPPDPTQDENDSREGAAGTVAGIKTKPKKPATSAQGISPTSIAAAKPKKPSIKVTKSEAQTKCQTCGILQFKDNLFVGCSCFRALAKSVKVSVTDTGYSLTFGSDWDSDGILALKENFRE